MLYLQNISGLDKIHTQTCNHLSAKPSGYFLFLQSIIIIVPRCLIQRASPELMEKKEWPLRCQLRWRKSLGHIMSRTETLPSKFPEVIPVKSEAAVHFSQRAVVRSPGPLRGGVVFIYFSIFQYCSWRFSDLSVEKMQC